ncbi:MAG: hypothetical protein ABSH19_08500 [Opitutales bacterium]|jgi:hypothetical protein
MKSRLVLLFAAFCALLAAPACPAQNTTPASAASQAPDPPHVQCVVDGVISFYFHYHDGLTLSQIVKNLPEGFYWANTSVLRIERLNTPQPIVVDYAAIAAGQAPDFPLVEHDIIHADPKSFTFVGGNPHDLINRISEFFGVDYSIASIPPDMSGISVPAFRIVVPEGPFDALNLYNRLSDNLPNLGKWFIQGDPYKPDVLMLTPPKDAADSEKSAPRAQALPIADIPNDKWDAIGESIRRADLASQEFAGSLTFHRSGQLLFQNDTKILVVIGPPSYIELVQSVVTAFRQNAIITQTQLLQSAGPSPDATAPATTSPPPPSSSPK